MKSKKAVLWDNDGVLVDTDRFFFQATRKVMSKIGLDLTEGMYVKYVLSFRTRKSKGSSGKGMSCTPSTCA
jgi:beta-phosphoglucomutase-like phosphatase (HAD superfamily)